MSTVLCALWTFGPEAAEAEQRPGQERIDFTAYTLRQSEFAVGLGSASFGVIDEITVGTYVLPWFAFPWLRAPIASGFIKLRDWFEGPVALAVRGTFVYLNASALASRLSKNDATQAGFWVMPLELSASVRIHPVVSQSVQLTWVQLGLTGDVPSDTSIDLGLGGASTASNLSLSSLTEFRLNSVVALTLRASLLLAASDIIAEADLQRGDTRVRARLGAAAYEQDVVANVIPGIAFSWRNVNLHLGVGFGANWVPYVAMPTRLVTVVPDADFYVRF